MTSAARTMTEERWIWPGLVEKVGGRWRLVASRCGDCGTTTFPVVDVCAQCLSLALERQHLAPEGIVHSLTTVTIAPPGFESPYGLAWVDFPEGARVFGQIELPLHVAIGDRVEVTVAALRSDPDGGESLGHRFRRIVS